MIKLVAWTLSQGLHLLELKLIHTPSSLFSFHPLHRSSQCESLAETIYLFGSSHNYFKLKMFSIKYLFKIISVIGRWLQVLLALAKNIRMSVHYTAKNYFVLKRIWLLNVIYLQIWTKGSDYFIEIFRFHWKTNREPNMSRGLHLERGRPKNTPNRYGK